MKHLSKRLITLFLGIMMLFTVIPVSAFAANYDTNYAKYPVPTRTLKYTGGTTLKGNDVRWFQCAINDLVSKGKLSTDKLDVDGSFGKASRTAVYAFQAKYKNYDKNNVLAYDGCFGPASRTVMQKVLKDSSSACTHYYMLTGSKDPTCYSNGYYKYVCKWCQNPLTVTRPAGHNIVTVIKGGFKKEYCSNCSYVKYDEAKEMKTWIRKYTYSINEDEVISNLKKYNSSISDEDKKKVSELGTWFSITSKLLNDKELEDLGTICEYMNLSCALYDMFSENTSNYERLDAVINTLQILTAKVKGTKYTIGSGLSVIAKDIPKLLSKVRNKQRVAIFYDWASSDIPVTINKKEMVLQRMKYDDLINKYNRDAVEAALKKHYDASYDKFRNWLGSNIEKDQYVQLFFDAKYRQSLSKKTEFTDFVLEELNVNK